jgi:hypothetical protein
MQHDTCYKKYKMSDWSAVGLFGKYRRRQFQRYLQKALKPCVKAAPNNVQKWEQLSQESMWESEGGSGRWGRKASDGI